MVTYLPGQVFEKSRFFPPCLTIKRVETIFILIFFVVDFYGISNYYRYIGCQIPATKH